MMKLFQILAVSTILFFTSCNGIPKKPKFHAAVGLQYKTLRKVIKHRPVKVVVTEFKTGKNIEITIYRDDNNGR